MPRRASHAFLLGCLMSALVSAGRSAVASTAVGDEKNLAHRVTALESSRRPAPPHPTSLLQRIERLERAERIEAERVFRSTPWGSPVAGGVVTSGASPSRLHPILGRPMRHNGVDIGTPAGSPIRATADGLVSSTFDNPTYGLGVDLDHGDGSYTRYAHMARVTAVPGQRVRRGTVIGIVGATGRATGPHVHYEVFVRWRRVDPAAFLGDAMSVAERAGGPTDF